MGRVPLGFESVSMVYTLLNQILGAVWLFSLGLRCFLKGLNRNVSLLIVSTGPQRRLYESRLDNIFSGGMCCQPEPAEVLYFDIRIRCSRVREGANMRRRGATLGQIGLSGAGKSETCYKRREKRIAKRRTGRVLYKLGNADERCTARFTLPVIVLTDPLRCSLVLARRDRHVFVTREVLTANDAVQTTDRDSPCNVIALHGNKHGTPVTRPQHWPPERHVQPTTR